MNKDPWIGKWIVEIIDDEVCIGQIATSQANEFDDEYRDFQLKPVIVWIPNDDDWEKVEGIRVFERNEMVPFESIAFNVGFVRDDMPSDHDVVKFLFEFNQKKT